MLSWSNTTTAAAQRTLAIGPAYVNNTQYIGVWCATARDLTLNGGGAGVVSQEASRTSTTCYLRGVSEQIRIQTSSATPFLWRRIAFCIRGNTPFNALAPTDTPVQTLPPFVDASSGMGRPWINQSLNNTGNTTSAQLGILFKGTAGQDWDDVMTAQPDNRRIDLKYDRTRVIRSGNQNGTILDFKIWHRMNKNLVYDDDEAGEVETSSYYSVNDKRGMGDFYIMDFIQAGAGGTTTDLLRIGSTATLYWHEK